MATELSLISIPLLSLLPEGGTCEVIAAHNVVIKTALRSGRKQSSVPVYLGKWLEQQETDLPVSMVSSWFHSSLYGFTCVVMV